MTLRNATIKLAHENPELRDALLPLIKEAEMSARFLAPYKAKAIKALAEYFKQVEAGYGAGNAIGGVAEVLKAALPARHLGFLPDALRKH